MKTIRSLIKEQNKNLIRPKFALVCAYLFGILGQALPVGSVQEVDNVWITKAMSLAVIFTAGAQIICTVRAGFARPKTWLKESVTEITSLTDEQCASTWNRAAETVGCSD